MISVVNVCRTNQLDGHVNLRDAAHGQCSFKDPKSGKQYSLKEKVSFLLRLYMRQTVRECTVKQKDVTSMIFACTKHCSILLSGPSMHLLLRQPDDSSWLLPWQCKQMQGREQLKACSMLH